MIEQLATREARTLSTVWLGLAFSIAVYVMVGSIVSSTGEVAAVSRAQVSLGALSLSLAAVRAAFMALGLVLLAGAAWVARSYLAEDRVIANAAGRSDEDRVLSGFAYLRHYSFLAWGLADGVILAGTLLAVMSGRAIDIFPFAIAGGTGLFLLKPEVPSLVDLAERMRGQALG